MGSYFLIEMDTTSPFIEIYSPSYATPQSYVEIVIQSNEILSEYQDMYIIDSKGDRHDYTLSYKNNKFTLITIFNNYPFGTATIYARVKDEVGNLSNQAIKSINIIESNTLSLELGAISRSLLIMNENALKLEINVSKIEINSNVKESMSEMGFKYYEIENDWSERDGED